MNQYNIDQNQNINENVPPEERGVSVMQWLRLLTKPLMLIYNVFIAFKDDTIYMASITSQVIYLEKLLNDKFDNTLRRIFITNNNFIPPQYIYNAIELNQEVYLYNTAENGPNTYLDNLNSGGTVNFIVHIPNGLNFNLTQLKGYLNKYKLASKSYTIVFF